MCGCSKAQSPADKSSLVNEPGWLKVGVEDMTCGHCAQAITKALRSGLPGVSVEADPATKLVGVKGSADVAAIMAVIRNAGYTPTLA